MLPSLWRYALSVSRRVKAVFYALSSAASTTRIVSLRGLHEKTEKGGVGEMVYGRALSIAVAVRGMREDASVHRRINGAEREKERDILGSCSRGSGLQWCAGGCRWWCRRGGLCRRGCTSRRCWCRCGCGRGCLCGTSSRGGRSFAEESGGAGRGDAAGGFDLL